MEARDLIVTPTFLLIIYVVAYWVRARVTDDVNRKYFIPALTVKIIGAISVGLVYQFYYGGGDTFNYHTYGSRIVWEAFMESPFKWLKLVFGQQGDETGVYRYTSRILFYSDPSSYAIVRLASIFDLLTFSSYSATAVLFAVFSFIGMWLLFITFYNKYPELHSRLAAAVFFIPSVFFWGSGLLKDTVTLGCLGMATYCIHRIFVSHHFALRNWLLLAVAFFGLYSVKLYILLVFLPAAVIWIFLSNLGSVRSAVLKAILFPVVISVACLLGYTAMIKASEDNAKYSVRALAKTAQVTAYDIRYYTGKDAGSGYSLGELDGTFGSMIRLAPQSVNVSLFRPYLWEVSNPLMLFSGIESTLFLLATILILIKRNIRTLRAVLQPDMFFALLFSLVFAFAVGVSTYNFGTLVRYKIPMLPFYAIALVLFMGYSNKERNVDLLEAIE